MQKKYGKWYADWRDSKGRRHRRAFDTQQEAAAHVEAMRDAQAPLKKASPQRPPSRKPRRNSPARRLKTRTRKARSRTS